MLDRLRTAAGALLRPVQFLAYWLAGFVPRRADRWALGCWSGHRYGDNAGALFEYLGGPGGAGIDAAWITRERSIRNRLTAEGRQAYTVWSPRGVWFALRAGVFVYDSLPKDIDFWLSRGAHLVQLRHGIGLKKIERAIDAPDHRLYKLFHGTPVQRLVWRILLPWHVPVPDLLMASSPIHAEQGCRYYGTTMDRTRITGFPRHDRLAEPVEQDRTQIPTLGAPVPSDRPVFVYLPTFREGLTRQSFDWDVLERAAAAAGVTIAVKLHYVDAQRGVLGRERVDEATNLRMIDPTIDPADAYPHADGMISDYSSAPFDFMLLERPIVYYVPDLDTFATSRPFAIELTDVAVGPLCRTGDELADALAAARRDGVGRFRARYDELRDRFHTHPLGGASARVVDAIRDEYPIPATGVRA